MFLKSNEQDEEVSVEEFKAAVQKVCVGKAYAEFPLGFRSFIESSYKTVDVDGNSKGLAYILLKQHFLRFYMLLLKLNQQ